MNATDILEHLRSLATGPPPEEPVDRVIYGDPDRAVEAIAVCFMPYRETVVKAHEIGANVMVVHEPTFYAHLDLDDKQFAALPATKEKMELIDQLGITIVRCHDVWDCGGTPNNTFVAWARFLGLEPATTNESGAQYVCTITEQKAIDFARHVAAKTAGMEQPQTVVRFYGDPEREINTVSVWGDPFMQATLGADLSITYDDHPHMRAWIGSAWCRDTGYPVVVVNHGVLEEPGVATLADHLRDAFPKVPVTHLRQGCVYREVLSS